MTTDIKTVWNFVEQYYPNYISSDSISENNDLQKILDGEIDENVMPIYGEVEGNIQENFNYTLYGEELKNEVLKEIQIQKNASDASIYEEAIKAYIESINVAQIEEKTYYLFGEDVVRALSENGIEAVIELIEDNEVYSTLVFIEGVTKSVELANEIQGYNDYAIISEEEYNKIKDL